MAEIAVMAAIEVLKKTSGLLVDLVVKEGSHLSRLQEEILWVDREMRRIQSYLKDVEYKQGDSESVANLMTDIRDLAFDVEDVMEKYFPPKKKGFMGFLTNIIPHIFSYGYDAHNFIAEIESIKIRVEEINRVRQTYGISEHSDKASVERDRWDERRPFPHVDEPHVTGFEDHIQQLVRKVHDEDSKLCVISIIGMAGLGKTTLAKKIYNSVQHSFHLRAWVYVSEQPIVKNIFRDIARQVGLEKEKWEDNDEATLFRHLSQHRYVIVFDDIWHTQTWDAINNAIPSNSENRSRIILTSRNRDVGVHVGGWSSLFLLRPLEKSFSKQLFETLMGAPPQTENDPPQLEKIVEKILYRCGGVPLAIVVVAGLLKLKERSDSAWNEILEQMDQAEGKCSEVFALSYKDLPTKLKPCFLYFGLFPEDHEISTFDLINLWAAEGFIKGSSAREVEEVGEGYLNHLIVRNLIQVVRKRSNGKVKSCRIHDILRSLCIRVAKEINFLNVSTDLTHHNGMRARRLTTHGIGLKDHILSTHQTPKLRSIFCFNDEVVDLPDKKVLSNFPKDINFLHVLYFHISMDPRLFSKEIWSFRNLTYLKLQNDGGPAHIPKTIIILERLVTLDLQAFGMSLHFPMVIWNMKRLRHLLLPQKVRFVTYTCQQFNPNAISFQNFQTITSFSEIFVADWLHKLSNLRTLKIDATSTQVAELLLTSPLVLNKLEKLRMQLVRVRMPVRTLNLLSYQNLSSLRMRKVDIDEWPEPDKLPPNLTKIVLYKSSLKEDPLEIMKKIPKLRILRLVYGSYAGGKMVCSGEPGNFPQLEELTVISGCVFEITIEEEGMPRLKKLHLEGIMQPKVPSRIQEIMTFSSY